MLPLKIRSLFLVVITVIECFLVKANGQNYTCSTMSTCFECFGISGCGFCSGPSNKCYAGGPNGPNDTSVCTSNSDTWIGTAQDCPDPCYGNPSWYQCLACIQATSVRCGFCLDGGGCRSGTISGPWSNQIPYCTEWRFSGMMNLSDNVICASLNPCDQQNQCGPCISNYEALGENCLWCGNSTDNSRGVCLSPNATKLCLSGNYSSSWTLMNNTTQCPSSPSDFSYASTTLFLYMRFCLWGFLFSFVFLAFV